MSNQALQLSRQTAPRLTKRSATPEGTSVVRRHLAGHVTLTQFLFVVPADRGVFVFILDQGAALLHVDVDAIFTPLIGSLKADGVKPAAVADRQMTRRCRSGIKMLMKPAAGRAIDASLFPFNLYYIIAAATLIEPSAELLVPKQNISRRLQSEKYSARAEITDF